MAVDLERGHEHRLEQEKALLRTSFGARVPADVLDAAIEATVASFAGARIQEYVPVLVHRTVRDRLRAYC